MKNKNKDIDMKDIELDEDGLPSDEDLDRLQRAIDMEIDGVSHKSPESGSVDTEQNEDKIRIDSLESELSNLKDKALRAMADADNVKKRAEREINAAKTFGIERFAVDMLSVHDNLSRALLTLDGKARDDMGANAKNLLDGIELTEKDLILTLSRHGVKPVVGVGSKFDPNVHQAVAQIPSDEEKGNVATVMQTGFTLGDRTLRAAMVAVSTGPSKK
ncbi:MAG: nucleotide exchange factor GrpE [Hellea sp.]|nr:nucleotide exchange factor GrpE [Hellea sp.]MDG2362131.1 nucleotide exchange factor GrpE [Hellea sp.]|tara:strand:+ start:90 stop:740 length:651 start_codon:yes stop_codon:yes gene_type:complete